jgi:Mycothiol maleylpyruvate isomerase N-terminal domain
MGARAEALAEKFEAKAQEATTVIERLSDADWKKVTAGEKWTVGVVAHHIAGSHEPIGGIVKGIASGQAMPGFTMEMLHDMNAQHAREHANCTKAETLDLHKKGAAAAAAIVRSLDDASLGRTAVVLTGMPAMSAEQAIDAILVNHVEEHLKSIRTAIGA